MFEIAASIINENKKNPIDNIIYCVSGESQKRKL